MHLDLTLRHFTRPAGPLLVIGTWLCDDEEQWRPVLALLRADDEMRKDPPVCLIQTGTAWVWSEQIGDPAAAARAALAFAEILRLTGDQMKNAMRIARVVNDHLADLISIPPLPNDAKRLRVVAEGIIRDDSGKASEFSIHA